MSLTLDLTDEQVALRDKTHAFAQEVIRPVAAEYDRPGAPLAGTRGGRAPGALSMAALGPALDGPHRPFAPDSDGGAVLGLRGIGLTIVLPALALAAIRQAATDEQLIDWAPQCFGTAGRHQAGRAGGHRTERRKRRTRDPDPRASGRQDWMIDGHKVFIGNGGIADIHVVVATVDPDAGHRGQGVFIVPKGTSGLAMLRKLDKLGCRASHTGEIMLENCRVPR